MCIPCCSKQGPACDKIMGRFPSPRKLVLCARGPCWWQNDGNVFLLLLGEEVWSCNPLGGEGHMHELGWQGGASSYIPSYSIAAAHLQPNPGGQPTHQPSKLAFLIFFNHSLKYCLQKMFLKIRVFFSYDGSSSILYSCEYCEWVIVLD